MNRAMIGKIISGYASPYSTCRKAKLKPESTFLVQQIRQKDRSYLRHIVSPPKVIQVLDFDQMYVIYPLGTTMQSTHIIRENGIPEINNDNTGKKKGRPAPTDKADTWAVRVNKETRQIIAKAASYEEKILEDFFGTTLRDYYQELIDIPVTA